MEYYVKTIWTKTTLPCDCHDKFCDSCKQKKKDPLKRGEIDIRSSTGLIVISIDFFS